MSFFLSGKKLANLFTIFFSDDAILYKTEKKANALKWIYFKKCIKNLQKFCANVSTTSRTLHILILLYLQRLS